MTVPNLGGFLMGPKYALNHNAGTCIMATEGKKLTLPNI